MTSETAITGIVLAGGKSSRMGTDKGLLLFRGKPLVQYSIELLSKFCSRILISSNNPLYNSFGYEVVGDLLAGAGPMAGIAACLAQSNTDVNLVLSCDMPFVDPVIFQTLLKLSGNYTFVIPVDNEGRIEPLCGVYKKNSLLIMHTLLSVQSFRMTELFTQAPALMVGPEEYPVPFHDKWFMNVNTISDLDVAGNF